MKHSKEIIDNNERAGMVSLAASVGRRAVSAVSLVRDTVVALSEELDGDCIRPRPGTPTLPPPTSSHPERSTSQE